tara:strand:- start:534 stop:1895 length:1362 start_codon:yes stop_codon:yes gene_type:complete
MASTYVNNLRLNEMATGDASGSWGTNTNINLTLIGEAFGWGTRAIANASTDNMTIGDGNEGDADRSLAIKLTGGGQACTVTLLPNTVSKVWVMYNATSYTLTFTQGSGANVAIPAGQTKIIATDGGGSGAVVYDLLVNTSFNGDVNLTGTVLPTGDTAAGDAAAFGYTAALGAILTGQGSTNDITLVNDADATVVSIPTGTTNVTVAGKLGVGGDTAAGDDAAIGYTAAEGLILTGQGSTSDITLKNDADATVFTVPTGTDDILFPDSAKAMFGAGSDLQIFYDGSNAFINNTVAGALSIKSDDINLMSSSSETMAAFVEDGAVTLYHNNAAKIATSATGVSVTGTAVATTDTDTSNTGSVTLDFGANQNFVLTLTGNTTLANPSTEQVGQSGFIACIQDGTGSRTLSLGTDYETAGGSGITLTTTASATDLIPYVVVASGRILLGTPQLAFS